MMTARPGWRTDRGAVYIVNGPPDEIESHPTPEYEVWRYRNTESYYYFSGADYRLDKAKSKNIQ
jgi:GWxTD domain-containing protein